MTSCTFSVYPSLYNVLITLHLLISASLKEWCITNFLSSTNRHDIYYDLNLCDIFRTVTTDRWAHGDHVARCACIYELCLSGRPQVKPHLCPCPPLPATPHASLAVHRVAAHSTEPQSGTGAFKVPATMARGLYQRSHRTQQPWGHQDECRSLTSSLPNFHEGTTIHTWPFAWLL